MVEKPTIGRIVRYSMMFTPYVGPAALTEMAAIVTAVYDDNKVDLCAFPPCGVPPMGMPRVKHADPPVAGSWRWPPRVGTSAAQSIRDQMVASE